MKKSIILSEESNRVEKDNLNEEINSKKLTFRTIKKLII